MAIKTASSKILATVEHVGKLKEGQYGPARSILFMRSDLEGDEAKVWKTMKPHDAELFRRGQQVYLIPAKREGGKDSWDIELLDNAPPPPTATATPSPQAPRIPDNQKTQIANYATELTKLLGFCRKQVQQELGDVDEETIRASTASIFITVTRKFNL